MVTARAATLCYIINAGRDHCLLRTDMNGGRDKGGNLEKISQVVLTGIHSTSSVNRLPPHDAATASIVLALAMYFPKLANPLLGSFANCAAPLLNIAVGARLCRIIFLLNGQKERAFLGRLRRVTLSSN